LTIGGPAPGESLTAFAERSLRDTDARAAAAEDERDIGDKVADLMDADLNRRAMNQGKTRTRPQGIVFNSEAPRVIDLDAGDPLDMGDVIVDMMAGKPAPIVKRRR
jgi:hypothetical protein